MTTTFSLDNFVSSYSIFKSNQVLTEQQLNSIAAYLDQQNRLTRACMIGSGIVCGLNITFINNIINISSGAASTTDGDLVKVSELKSFSKFKVYATEPNVKVTPYPHFTYVDNAPQNLWELLPDEADGTDLDQFAVTTGLSLNDMVVIVYLEQALSEPQTCTDIDCDTLGCSLAYNTRFLLLSTTEMQSIINNHDDVYRSCANITEKYFELQDLIVPRVILTEEIAESYRDQASLFTIKINEYKDDLIDALFDMYEDFNLILGLRLNQNSVWRTTLNARFTGNTSFNALNAQYLYDHIKDITAAYTEVRDLLYDICVECCPDPRSFAKHIMLGNLGNLESFRHQFYPSPIITKGDERMELAKYHIQKLNRIILDFKIPEATEPIVITPTHDYDKALSLRAIPFYYNLNTQSDALNKFWNPVKLLQKRTNTNLGYHFNEKTGNIGPDSVRRPLNFNIDQFDFFRIEGHIGKLFPNVIEELESQKQEFGLPLDFVGLRLGTDTSGINTSESRFEFPDLETQYAIWENEQKCLLEETRVFLGQFNPRGFHNRYPLATPANPRVRTRGEAINFASLGEAFDQTNVRQVNPSYADYVLAVNGELQADIPAEINAQIRTLTITNPVALLSKLVVLLNKVNADDLYTINADQYFIAYDDMVVTAQTAYTDLITAMQDATYVRQGYEDEMCKLLQHLIHSCQHKDLEVLKAELERKTTAVKQSLLFSKFVSKHPGVEHKAGAHRGGMFILVYYTPVQNTGGGNAFKSNVGIDENVEKGENVESAINVESNSAFRAKAGESALPNTFLQKLAASQEESKEASKEETQESALRITNQQLQDIKGQFSQLGLTSNTLNQLDNVLDNLVEPLNIRPIDVLNLPTNTVVADYCLPYLCCGEGGAIAYVFNEEPEVKNVTIQLVDSSGTPVNEVDLATYELCGDKTSPHDFRFTPAGGTLVFEKTDGTVVPLQLQQGATFDFATLIIATMDLDSYKATYTLPTGEESIVFLRIRRANAAFTHVVDTINLPASATVTFTAVDTAADSYEWTVAGTVVAATPTLSTTLDVTDGPVTVSLRTTSGTCSDVVPQTFTARDLGIDTTVNNSGILVDLKNIELPKVDNIYQLCSSNRPESKLRFTPKGGSLNLRSASGVLTNVPLTEAATYSFAWFSSFERPVETLEAIYTTPANETVILKINIDSVNPDYSVEVVRLLSPNVVEVDLLPVELDGDSYEWNVNGVRTINNGKLRTTLDYRSQNDIGTSLTVKKGVCSNFIRRAIALKDLDINTTPITITLLKDGKVIPPVRGEYRVCTVLNAKQPVYQIVFEPGDGDARYTFTDVQGVTTTSNTQVPAAGAVPFTPTKAGTLIIDYQVAGSNQRVTIIAEDLNARYNILSAQQTGRGVYTLKVRAESATMDTYAWNVNGTQVADQQSATLILDFTTVRSSIGVNLTVTSAECTGSFNREITEEQIQFLVNSLKK